LDHSDSGPETAWGHIVARVLIEKSIEDRHSISKSVISVSACDYRKVRRRHKRRSSHQAPKREL